MEVRVEILSDQELTISDLAIFNLFIDGKQIPCAYSSSVKARQYFGVTLFNPLLEIEVKKKERKKRRR